MKIKSSGMIILIILSIFLISIEVDLFAEDRAGCYPDQKQITFQRHYLKDSLEVVRTINLLDLDPELFEPYFCQIGPQGDIYLMDYGSMFLYRINPITDHCTRFGQGQGKGPGEFINPNDFKVKDTLIFIPDYRNGKITMYTTSGNFVRDIKIGEKSPERVIIQENNQIIFNKHNEVDDGNFFSVYDYQGHPVCNFGCVLVKREFETMSQKTMYYESEMAAVSDTSFVYANSRTGYLGLCKHKQLVLRTTTVDGVQNPGFDIKKFMIVYTLTRVDAKALYTAAEMASNGDYVLIEAYDPSQKKSFFDLYNAENLQYIISLKLPQSMDHFDVNDDHIIGLCDDYAKLVIYKWPGLN